MVDDWLVMSEYPQRQGSMAPHQIKVVDAVKKITVVFYISMHCFVSLDGKSSSFVSFDGTWIFVKVTAFSTSCVHLS